MKRGASVKVPIGGPASPVFSDGLDRHPARP